jgi:hypothetical protein
MGISSGCLAHVDVRRCRKSLLQTGITYYSRVYDNAHVCFTLAYTEVQNQERYCWWMDKPPKGVAVVRRLPKQRELAWHETDSRATSSGRDLLLSERS